tara:strand:- start:657 stop:794 length:138 start_codon:yes stop_codon:yes gene_type:complete
MSVSGTPGTKGRRKGIDLLLEYLAVGAEQYKINYSPTTPEQKGKI